MYPSNFFRIRSYRQPSCNPFRFRSYKNTGGWGSPNRDLHRPCTEAQKRPPVSPFPATLTHSLSCNPFVCHSYENTWDGYATALLHSPIPPSHASRGASIPCALSRLRTLSVTTGVCPLRPPYSALSCPLCCAFLHSAFKPRQLLWGVFDEPTL